MNLRATQQGTSGSVEQTYPCLMKSVIATDDIFPTLLDLFPNAIEQDFVKTVTDLYRDSLVTFLMPREHYAGQYQAIGTGFFLFSPDPTYGLLMTARHVLEGFDFAVGKVTIGTRVLFLGDIGLRRLDPHLDMAQWQIPANCLIEEGIEGIHTLPISIAYESREVFKPMDSFVLLGYPCSRNKGLDFRNGRKPDREIFGLALHGSKVNISTRIREFEYNGRGTPEAWNKLTTTPPFLRGMSGAPCLRFVLHRETSSIGVVLAGVFFAWNSQNHKLSVASVGDPWTEFSK